MELKKLIEKTAMFLSESTENLKEFELDFSVHVENEQIYVNTKDVRIKIKAKMKNKKAGVVPVNFPT